MIALQLEATFSKEEILGAYSNQIYFGNGAYGVEEASQIYFGKRANEITLLQAAVLAGLPNSPNNANPFSNFDRAMERARYILKRMQVEHWITAGERQEALDSELELRIPKTDSNPNNYFTNFVIDKLVKDYGKEFVHYGGLKVYTTLNGKYQRLAQKAAESHLEALEERLPSATGPDALQVALLAIENKSGAVRSMLGGRDYSHSQFNRAISNNRLPGSSFKPFVYFAAMEKLGYTPATVIRDEPTVIEISRNKTWEPKNFDGGYFGDIILKKAMMKSLNVVSAKLTQIVTPDEVIKTARQFGITSPLGNNMSLALGTSSVSPLEMAGAYSVIANLGIYNEPYFIERIEDYQGKTLFTHYYQGVQKFSQKMIYLLSDMMQGVVDGGTGRIVRRMGFKHPAGGKTGTTNDFKDAWFNGFTKDFSVSVWVGRDNNESMIDKKEKGFTGGGAAAPIWVYFLQKVLDSKNGVKFPVPPGIKLAAVDIRTGLIPGEGVTDVLQVAVKEEVELRPPTQEEEGESLGEPESDSFLTTEELNAIPIP
jgi:penicillin-binding protein 1A